MSTFSSLLHPVRFRIAQILLGEGELTTHYLHERLPEVPIATLYRHIANLVDHQLIEVVSEKQVRGASEKTYRLVADYASPTLAELESLSKEELLTMFTVFMSGVIHDFDLYLQEGDFNLSDDQVSFAQASFWADDSEVDAFGHSLMTALEILLHNKPKPGRRRRTLTTVLMPREGENQVNLVQRPAEESS